MLSLMLNSVVDGCCGGGGGEEWVEILEPQSREKMFANPITGEILLQPPYGATVYEHTHTHTHIHVLSCKVV